MTSPEFRLRRFIHLDHPFLEELFATTREPELAALPRDRHEWFVRTQHEAQHRDYSARFPHSDHYIIEVTGRPGGRVWVDRGPEEYRVLDIAVLPRHRNRGLGSHILTDLHDEATAAGVPLVDSVFKTNVDALRLYERLGFRKAGETDSYWFVEWV